MPVDPSISLAASATGLPAGGNALVSPLDTLSKFATIQNNLNQNRLFQQTFAAKQKAGQIIAGATDLETGLANLYKDPDVAPFAGEIVNNTRQGILAGVQIARERQGMAQSALGNSLKMLTGIMANPGMTEHLVEAGRAVTDPSIRSETDAATSSLIKAVTAGIPAGASPEEKARQFQKNAAAILSSVVTPEVIQMYTASPRTVAGIDPRTGLKTEQGALQPGILNPLLPGGALIPAGAGIVTGATPGELISTHPGAATPGGAPTVVTGGQIFGGQVPGLGVPGLPARSNGLTGAGPAIGPLGPNALGAPEAPLTAPPAVGVQTKLDPRGEKFQQDVGGKESDYKAQLADRVQVGTGIVQTVGEAREALQQIKAGGGATFYSRLAQIAQAIGAPDELVDRISNRSLSASQEFAKLMVNTTMGQIQQQLAGIGASRLSQMEFAAFMQNNPNLDTDPRAIEKIFDFWTKIYNRDVKEQRELNTYLKKPGASVSDWQVEWQRRMEAEGLLRTSTKAAGQQGKEGEEERRPSPASPASRPPLADFFRPRP